jgi:hypothetical protein
MRVPLILSYRLTLSQLKLRKAGALQAKSHLKPWDKNTRETARNYLNYISFSRTGLIDQLLFEGFTAPEAEYGVTQNRY